MSHPIRSAICGATLLLTVASASAGTFTYSPFTGDADSGISPALTYTATADLHGSGLRVVNNVPFSQTGPTGTSYTLTGVGASFINNANNVTGEAGGLLTDFLYTGDGSGNASLTLEGLIVGQQYVTSWYNAGFGPAGGRNINITASDTNSSIFFDQDYTNKGNGNILRYAFTATAPTITYSFDADGNGHSFHHYAFSNAIANTAVLATPVITAATGAGPAYSPFPVRSDDLLQTHLGSVLSGGNFNIEGAGGIPALTNGTFAINGGNPSDNSPLATGENNAFVEFKLDITTNAQGYDISSIESFGGWNDAGRDRQLFKISYSLVGSEDFIFLGSMDFNPATTTVPSAVRGVFDTALTGVDALRFDFFGSQENGYAGYGEFDVVGVATVPEPTAMLLGLVGFAGLVMRRRR